jgi:(R,R)-butanediol dehydrogenase/meso-butanediol dehydrogenase/diacetyl reductase
MEHIVVAEPLGCVMNGINKAGVRAGETAVVLGGGPIGLLSVAVLKAMGAGRVVLVEPAKVRADLGLRLGADAVVDPRQTDDVSAAVKAAAGTKAPTVIIEAVGSQLGTAVRVAGNGCRIVVIGINSAAEADFSPAELVRKEIVIVGAWLMRYTMRQALDMIQAGLLPMDVIVTHVLPLSDVHAGLEIARRGEGLKVVFQPGPTAAEGTR